MQLEHPELKGDFEGVNLHLLLPPTTKHRDPVLDNAKMSHIGCSTLANGMHAKRLLLDLAKNSLLKMLSSRLETARVV